MAPLRTRRVTLPPLMSVGTRLLKDALRQWCSFSWTTCLSSSRLHTCFTVSSSVRASLPCVSVRVFFSMDGRRDVLLPRWSTRSRRSSATRTCTSEPLQRMSACVTSLDPPGSSLDTTTTSPTSTPMPYSTRITVPCLRRCLGCRVLTSRWRPRLPGMPLHAVPTVRTTSLCASVCGGWTLRGPEANCCLRVHAVAPYESCTTVASGCLSVG